jgi:hypothetical protein
MSFLRRLFTGSGEMPGDVRNSIASDQLLLVDEGLPGSVTFRHLRAPGRRAAFRKTAVSGGFALTARRLVVWAGRHKQIDVPLDHPLWREIDIDEDEPGRVCFAFELGAFSDKRSGRMELRFRTAKAARLRELLATR